MSQETGTPEAKGHAHPTPKTYVIVFFWLFVITLVEIYIAFLPMPKALMATLFIVMALMKVALIGGFFMHLIYEKVNLIYVLVLPLILLLVLLIGLFPDALSVVAAREG